jgi:hypothetical protein
MQGPIRKRDQRGTSNAERLELQPKGFLTRKAIKSTMNRTRTSSTEQVIRTRYLARGTSSPLRWEVTL